MTVSIAGFTSKDNGWFEATADNGDVFATKKTELGQKLKASQGQLVEIAYTKQVKGDYTNLYVDDVTPVANGAAATISPAVTEPAQRSGGNMDQGSISRSVALKVAGHRADTEDELWTLVDQYVDYIENNRKPEFAGLFGS